MAKLAEFAQYIAYLCGEALDHLDRNVGLQDYCRGLMLPIQRKSIEPLAAHVDPLRVAAKHQSLHYFVAASGLLMTRVSRRRGSILSASRGNTAVSWTSRTTAR